MGSIPFRSLHGESSAVVTLCFRRGVAQGFSLFLFSDGALQKNHMHCQSIIDFIASFALGLKPAPPPYGGSLGSLLFHARRLDAVEELDPCSALRHGD